MPGIIPTTSCKSNKKFPFKIVYFLEFRGLTTSSHIVYDYTTTGHIYLYSIYRVIQEESAILWEMIVCVILSKKVHMNMCPIFDGYGVMGIF